MDTPGFDTFESATGNGGLLAIGRRPVPAGTTPQAWMSSLRREGSLAYIECGSMGKASADELAGGTAIRVLFPCPDEGVNAELVFAVHGGSGWALLCAADDTGTVSLVSVCGPLIGSFRYA